MTSIITQQRTQALFLDRDGVINEERPDDYVKSWDEFVFIPGAIEAIAKLSQVFPYLFIVTNQRGVGREIMSRKTLEDIHNRMLQAIAAQGGRIDKAYVCCDTDACSINRKPNIGMTMQALQDYPDIGLQDSIMVGNSLSDMKFGKNAGMTTILVGHKYPNEERKNELTDHYFDSLLSFALEANKFRTQTQ